MQVKYLCRECEHEGWVSASNNKVTCPICGTTNDYWIKGELPPFNHIKNELMWFIHNTIAHPLSELTYWLGFLHPVIRKVGDYLHEITIPAHRKGTGRG